MAFSISEVPQSIKDSMLQRKVWLESCPVSFEQLSYVNVIHYDFDGDIQKGQLVVCRMIATDVVQIFKELFDLKFPINSLKLIDEYGGNDNLSMEANNSSCFNHRTIAGTSKLSMHAYGLAIDINPLQNPMIVHDGESVSIYPTDGKNFLDRRRQRRGMIEPVVDIFVRNNLCVWGGAWSNPIDYHHFQTKTTFSF